VKLLTNSFASNDDHQMTNYSCQCLILACGNTLREDDGVGPRIAQWAEKRFENTSGVQIIARQQWTPELSEDIARAASVIFIDSAVDCAPGILQLTQVKLDDPLPNLATHHLGAKELLALSKELYGALPHTAKLLTIGAASLEMRQGLSKTVSAVLPRAYELLQQAVTEAINPFSEDSLPA
jgi:hydrogenase maturation protease